MRRGCKRFVAIDSKSFDLAIVATAEDVLKISENGRGRRTSLLLLENLSVKNKGKRTFVIFPASWNERGWAKIFDALTEIVNLTFSGASGALGRPLQQVTLAHGVMPPLLPPPPPPGCWPSVVLTKIASVIQAYAIGQKKAKGRYRACLRASSLVSTQVYSRRNNFGNRRNRVHESKGSNSEGRVSICANWPPDSLFVHETSSPSSDEAKSLHPALVEAKI
ncbi:hypothetical protein Cgig2_026396 [Carnegiea gigantea]|uniref:Uncharacterized protein n=1 Tax=Carnegiea gigantea TaxID=171969 RepID=A0A9Q1K1Y5_9CARY|nr:hypothetical protein Cgig2_026396 [Carnegiea gigantea]